MNLGRALLMGAAGGLKTAADQVAANQKLDNDLRLMAADDMLKQRAAEQGHEWQNELIDKKHILDVQDRDDERMYQDTKATDPEYNRKLGEAKVAQTKPGAEFEEKIMSSRFGDPNSDYAKAVKNESLAKNAASIETAKMHNDYLQDALKAKAESGLLTPRSSRGSGDGRNDLLKTAEQIDKTLDNLNKATPTTQEEANQNAKYAQELRETQRNIYKSLLSPISNSDAAQPNIPADIGDYQKYGLTKQEANKAIARDYSQYNIDAIAQQKGVDVNLMKGMLNSESSISDPNKVSSAGAKGPFQFIDGTWKRYADENMGDVNNPVHAANAAANYIKKMGDVDFNGNPALIAAGYNAGEGKVKEAINKLRSANKEVTTENILALMPSETRAYVPKVLAYKEFLDNQNANTQLADSGQIKTDATEADAARKPELNDKTPMDYLKSSIPKEPEAPKQPTYIWNPETSKENVKQIYGDNMRPEESRAAFVLLQQYKGNESQALTDARGAQTFKPDKDGKQIPLKPGEYYLPSLDQVIVDKAVVDQADQADKYAKSLNKENGEIKSLQDSIRKPIDALRANPDYKFDELEKYVKGGQATDQEERDYYTIINPDMPEKYKIEALLRYSKNPPVENAAPPKKTPSLLESLNLAQSNK